MPYGIHSMSEILQREIAKIISGIDGALNFQDDIIIWGDTKEAHDKRLQDVLQRVRDHGLKLNESKRQFGVTELTFLGHNISSKGVRPDKKKIEAITQLATPSNKVELQHFLGMATYLAKFIPHLSDVTSPPRLLLKKDFEFVMQKQQLDMIKKLKSLITSAPILHFFDPNLQIKLRTD